MSLGDPLAALTKLATGEPFDTIVLDVDMPRMNGYELCVKLRAIPSRAKTPVVFVTSLSDFQSCARSAISGGNDLIAKPTLPIELAVKAMMFVMKSRLGIVTKSVWRAPPGRPSPHIVRAVSRFRILHSAIVGHSAIGISPAPL